MSFVRLLIVVISVLSSLSALADKPALQHAKVYTTGIDLSRYWVSEKLDGVRGYWNGTHLLTRSGQPIHAPAWFVSVLPDYPLDGELWIARGQFEQISGLIRRKHTEDAEWADVKYMLFDLPEHVGMFSARIEAMSALIKRVDKPWVSMIPQSRFSSESDVMTELDRIVSLGGEGLMLHRDDAYYRSGRTNALLKLKPWADAEARVVAHLPGKGKYQHKLGALLVETPEGIRFKLGSGFSDAQRSQPPDIGRWVTYKYTGLTKNGVPRFASFLRLYSSN